MRRNFVPILISGLLLWALLVTMTRPLIGANPENQSNQSQQPIGVLAWLGIVLLGLQVYVAIRQAGITIDQNKILNRQTSILDRQTSLTEQALTISRQPRVYIDNLMFTTWDGNKIADIWTATFDLISTGDTPAIYYFVAEDLFLGEAIPPLSENPTGFIEKKPMAAGIKFPRTAPFLPTDSQKSFVWRSENPDNKWKLYLLGCVCYEDVFGHVHEMRFCYECITNGGGGHRAGGAKYNYTKTRHTRDALQD